MVAHGASRARKAAVSMSVWILDMSVTFRFCVFEYTLFNLDYIF